VSFVGKHVPNDENSLPQLLDLRVRIANCTKVEGRKDVLVDLRIHRTEIDGPEEAVISVQLKRATLELDLAGLEAVPKTRLGEPVRENRIVEKQTTKVTTTLDAKVGVHAGLDITMLNLPSLKLSADATAEAKATSVHTAKQDIAEYRVKARPGDTWEVTEPRTKTSGTQQQPLDGTYLLDEVLCKVAPQKGANMMSVGVTAVAKQRDMMLELTKGNLWQTYVNTSHEKLFKILLAKSLCPAGNTYSGLIKLSRSETDIEN
jgi:hypothetical protein